MFFKCFITWTQSLCIDCALLDSLFEVGFTFISTSFLRDGKLLFVSSEGSLTADKSHNTLCTSAGSVNCKPGKSDSASDELSGSKYSCVNA